MKIHILTHLLQGGIAPQLHLALHQADQWTCPLLPFSSAYPKIAKIICVCTEKSLKKIWITQLSTRLLTMHQVRLTFDCHLSYISQVPHCCTENEYTYHRRLLLVDYFPCFLDVIWNNLLNLHELRLRWAKGEPAIDILARSSFLHQSLPRFIP